uniref:Protein yippee-like n=1 Tax=Cyprinus carpio carpio TaxID=630221 RepID=A0A8C0YLW1_CYPCA
MVTMTRSKTFQAYLPSCHRTYSCIHCRAHLANHDELISKSFQGSQGRAYLFNSVVNVGCGPAEERVLLTGLHAVADIYCENCKTTLGWKYVKAGHIPCMASVFNQQLCRMPIGFFQHWWISGRP